MMSHGMAGAGHMTINWGGVGGWAAAQQVALLLLQVVGAT